MLQLLQKHEMHKYFVKKKRQNSWASVFIFRKRWLGKIGWNLERDGSISAATAERLCPCQ